MPEEIHAKSVLHRHGKAFPVMLDLNPYRGCTVGCKYCFAQYSHYYVGADDFFKDIFVKTNVSEVLDKELFKKKSRREQIKIGGVTDAYQHIEKKYKLMPDILKVLKKYRTPVFMSTKSDLILRDAEQIKELAELTPVDLAVSISCYDEKTAKIFEPGAPSPQRRIDILSEFKNHCRSISVLLMPILPYISDSESELEKIFAASERAGAEHLVAFPLHLRSQSVKSEIFSVIRRYFPSEYQKFVNLFTENAEKESYRENLYAILNKLRNKYRLFDDFTPLRDAPSPVQLKLF